LPWSALGLIEVAWSPSRDPAPPTPPAPRARRDGRTPGRGQPAGRARAPPRKAGTPGSTGTQPLPPHGGERPSAQHWDGHSPSLPAAASGTLNSLCRVLCTVRSLYLCAIGLVPVFQPCEGWTSPFKLHFQAALLAGEPGANPLGFRVPRRTGARLHGAVTLRRVPFQATWSGEPAAPQKRPSEPSPAPNTPHLRPWEPPTRRISSRSGMGPSVSRFIRHY